MFGYHHDRVWIRALPGFSGNKPCRMCGSTDIENELITGWRATPAGECYICHGAKPTQRWIGRYWGLFGQWYTEMCGYCMGTGLTEAREAMPSYMRRTCACGCCWSERTLEDSAPVGADSTDGTDEAMREDV